MNSPKKKNDVRGWSQRTLDRQHLNIKEGNSYD